MKYANIYQNVATIFRDNLILVEMNFYFHC